MSKCDFFEVGGFIGDPCPNEATHVSCEPYIGCLTCAEHKCRCAKTIVRAEAIKEPTPSNWMAL